MPMKNEKYVLLLTACIAPTATTLQKHTLRRSDPLVRMHDYKTALRYWLDFHDERITGIVFIDNSGHSLDELRQVAIDSNSHHRDVEFLKCEPEAIPDGLHYGYSELEMIDEAFDRSELIRECGYVIKATGRLYFPALSKLLDRISGDCSFVADCRDFKFGKYEKHYVLTTMFVVQRAFYQDVLQDAKSRMIVLGDGLIETLYFRLLKPLSSRRPDSVVLRFPINVDPVGVGAHWNNDYTSFKSRLVSTSRAVCRRCLPTLRI